jgi:hypothetical protein
LAVFAATSSDAGEDLVVGCGDCWLGALGGAFGVGADVDAEAGAFNGVTVFAGRSGVGCAKTLGDGVGLAGWGAGGVAGWAELPGVGDVVDDGPGAGDAATGWVARSGVGWAEVLGEGVGFAG